MARQTLGDLHLGQTAEIDAIEGGGMIKVRLLEMGFVPGTRVKLVKRAPTGDPLQFELRGYHLSLRRLEAARVQTRSR